MNIEKNKVVQFHYDLAEHQGDAIESSRTDGEPMAYLHGHDNVLPAMEKAMEGKAVGDKFNVVLSPEEAYGEPKEDAIQRVPVKHLQGAKRWKPGMIAHVKTEQGWKDVTVVKVGKFSADVDFNHPLCGKTLSFDLEIVDIRDATDEEVAHGHAHGPGGHHHH